MITKMSIIIRKDGKNYAIDTNNFVVDYEDVINLIATFSNTKKLKAFEIKNNCSWENINKIQ